MVIRPTVGGGKALLNAYYRTDWKRGDIVELLPEDGGGKGEQYKLTGRVRAGSMHLSAIVWNKIAPRGYRVPLHAKSIRRVENAYVPKWLKAE